MYRRRTGGTGTAAGATLTNRGIGAGWSIGRGGAAAGISYPKPPWD